MGKSILVTGVAGSGKSAVFKELDRLGYKAYDIEDTKGLFMMIDKKTKKPTKDYDSDCLESVKRHDWVCDKRKLQRLVHKNSKGTVFYCGTASNLDELLPLFDKILLLKASPKKLRERLGTRTSHDFGRTPEVQDWIFSWKDWWENRICEKGALVINANRSLQEVTDDIIKKSSS